MRKIAVLFCVLLVAPACSRGPNGPLSFAVSADAASPQGKNFQYSAFSPSALKARPGDTIVFDNLSTQAPHTVTFGVDAKRSNEPAVVGPKGENPAVFAPCYTDEDPSKAWTACPTAVPEKPPAYAGRGFWNSGVLVPSVAPEGPKSVSVKLADTIRPGTYRYECVLHAPMTGVIQVVEKDDARETPEAVKVAAAVDLKQLRKKANAIEDPSTTGLEGTIFKAAAGWGDDVTAVNRFFPADIQVPVGTTVSWKADSPFEPHDVAIGSKWPSGSAVPESFAPSGAKSGTQYAGGLASSGIFGGPATFDLVFAKAGTYPFVCTLHPGMEGTVTVAAPGPSPAPSATP